jgi:preprotein translocase subunit SecE
MDIQQTVQSNRILAYLQKSKEELEKVVWPTRQQVITHSLIVIGFVIVMGVFLGGLDFLFSLGVRFLIERGPIF